MAITTFAQFTNGLAGLSVTGVNRSYDHPPASIDTADLPALWIMLPSNDEPSFTFEGQGGWATLTCDVIIAVEPVGQNTQSANYDLTITILDNLCDALRDADIGRSKLTWAINTNVTIEISGTTYWAIVATVEGR